MIRTIYSRLLRAGRWLQAQRQAAVIRHGHLQIVPDRLIGPELKLWQDYLLDLLLTHPSSAEVRATLVLHHASLPSGWTGASHRVRFQPEHTLVKPGGGDSAFAPISQTLIPGSAQHYLFRLLHQDSLAAADLILDYCECNLRHWQDSGQLPALQQRARVLAPITLPVAHAAHDRNRAIVALFSNPVSARRRQFLQEAHAQGLVIQHAAHAYRRQRLLDLFDDTEILINMRQSEHHDTFEALRVLPALARGVLVVSEDVPLRSALPYQDCVIWADRSHLLETLQDVHSRPQHYWQAIFGSGRCQARLEALATENRRMLDEFLASLR